MTPKRGPARCRFAQHLPNALSLLRILLAVAFPALPTAARFPVLAAAALSDYLDGATARYFQVTSRLGAILDPLGDKIMVFAVVLALVVEHTLTWPEAILVLARDIAVVFGTLWLLVIGNWQRVLRLNPSRLGKLATLLQFAFLLSALALHERLIWLYAATAVGSVLAACDYFVAFWRRDQRAAAPVLTPHQR